MERKGDTSVWLLLGLMLSVTAGCGHLVYPSGPYNGRVVDADAGKPIVGAAVVAIWVRERPAVAEVVEGDWDVYETLSDANGEFTIPHRTHFTLFGWILEPKLVVYYPSYAPYRIADLQPEVRVTVPLKHLTTREERVWKADRPIGTLMVPADQIPNLTRLIDQERRQLGLEPLGPSRPKQ
jgi:hypothetical protein